MGFSRATAAQLGEDFPAEPAFPTKLTQDRETLEIDGVRFELHELGAGECNSMTAVAPPERGVAFVGDAISDQVTPALLQGVARELARLGGFTAALTPRRTRRAWLTASSRRRPRCAAP